MFRHNETTSVSKFLGLNIACSRLLLTIHKQRGLGLTKETGPNCQSATWLQTSVGTSDRRGVSALKHCHSVNYLSSRDDSNFYNA